MRPAQSIVLIGFMGAGKSLLSYHLEKITGLPRWDVDQIISDKFGLPIPEVFAQLGGDRFHEEEMGVIRNLSRGAKGIVVTGGGTIWHRESVPPLRRLGIVVFLTADKEILYRRIAHREELWPSNTALPRDEFFELWRSRESFYEKAADVRIDTSALNGKEAAQLVLKRVDEFAAGNRRLGLAKKFQSRLASLRRGFTWMPLLSLGLSIPDL